MTFRILTVCTGNVCRSPQAEQLLRARFASTDADVEIGSAGTHALVGQSMPDQAANLSREFGGDPDSHHPRRLTRDLIVEADLVLAMAREHRSAVAKLVPLASRKTFTLREFARVLDRTHAMATTTPAETVEASPHIELPAAFDLAAWLDLAQRYRGWFAGAPAEDDVEDPFHRSDDAYRRSVEQIAPAVRTIAELTASFT